MDIIIIVLFLAIIAITLFFNLKPSSHEKRNKDTESRKLPVDAQAESGTDKLIRRLNERENAEYNAELKAHRDQTPTPISPEPIPPQEQPPEIIPPEQTPPVVTSPQEIPPERIPPDRNPPQTFPQK